MVTSRSCKPSFGARQTDLEQAGTKTDLAGDERRAAGRATLLAVPVGKQRPFLGDAIDVRRLVAHHALVVGADVPVADVIAPDDDDVGFLVGCDAGPTTNATAMNRASPIAGMSLFMSPPS